MSAHKTQEIDYGFGQLGSVYTAHGNAITPPVGKVFVAITMLSNTSFTTAAGITSGKGGATVQEGGLQPQTRENPDGTIVLTGVPTQIANQSYNDEEGKDLRVAHGLEYIGTHQPAENAAVGSHNLAVNSETTVSGGGGQVITGNVVFPKGLTIYGRWTYVKPVEGSIIAYIGE